MMSAHQSDVAYDHLIVLCMVSLLEMLRRLPSQGMTPENKLRLIAIYIISQGGIPEEARRQVVEAAGEEEDDDDDDDDDDDEEEEDARG
jgi:hypothetical protein